MLHDFLREGSFLPFLECDPMRAGAVRLENRDLLAGEIGIEKVRIRLPVRSPSIR